MLFIKIRHNSSALLTPHFRESEFFCKSTDFKGEYHFLDQTLIFAAESIRELADAPVLISSSFRTVEGNKSCGGAPDSFHLKGMALDIQCPSKQELINSNIIQLAFLFRSLRSASINGFGISERFLHIDTRPTGNNSDSEFGSYALWYYPLNKEHVSD